MRGDTLSEFRKIDRAESRGFSRNPSLREDPFVTAISLLRRTSHRFRRSSRGTGS